MMDSRDLEQDIDRALKALPPPSAPPTLVANVMRAVATSLERPVPWSSRGWLAWPLPARAASLAFVVLSAIAFWREAPGLWAWAIDATAGAPAVPAWASGLADTAGRTLALARLPWQMLEPVASYFAVVAIVASLTLAASWQAFNRLVSGGVSLR